MEISARPRNAAEAFSIHISEELGHVTVEGLRIRWSDGDPNSVVGRLALALKDAVAEWQLNPNGPVQFREAYINNTWIGRLP